MKYHCKGVFSSVVLFVAVLSCAAQEDNLVVLFVNQDGNIVAQEAYQSVLKYVREMKIGINDMYRCCGPVNGTAEKFLDNLCSAYNKSIEDKTPPHLVLDMTRYDVPSETTKSFTKLLGLPTVAGSFGQDGDLRQWRNLEVSKRDKYLIQVNPPSDILVEVVREIVKSKQLSNAAVLFDDSVVMDHKYKSLLQNIPSRHLIYELIPARVRDQLQKLNALGLFNFFIVGRLSTIKTALDAGDGLKYFDGRFSWSTISLESADPSTNCSKCAFLHVKPKQERKTLSRLEMLKEKYSLKAEPPIEGSFYFDVMLRAILAANALKQKGAYKDWIYTTCDDYEEKMTLHRNIDLKEQFVAMGKTEQSSYADFTNKKNGYNWQNFVAGVRKLEVRDGKTKRVLEIATWRAGLNNPLRIRI